LVLPDFKELCKIFLYLTIIPILEKKIWIYWTESNSWIYFYIQLKLVISKFTRPFKNFELFDLRGVVPSKNFKIYWSEQSFTGLLLGQRTNKFKNLIQSSKFKFSFRGLELCSIISELSLTFQTIPVGGLRWPQWIRFCLLEDLW
jgi:hypothetical protein